MLRPGRARLSPGVAVLLLGLAVRVALIPLTSGQDFRVWDLASAATLRGVNVYAHHPHYPGGPYAYFPLFLWLELPFRWLAWHSPVSFVVLGKIPMLVADLALGWLVRAELLRRRQPPPTADLAMAALLLNPLILYNSAFYGRFDSVAVVLLFAAVITGPGTWRSAGLFALAVAAKTFPIVAVLAFVRRGTTATVRVALSLVVTLGVLLVPYRNSLAAVFHDSFLYDATKAPQALSWQQALPARWVQLLVVAVAVAVLVAAAGSPLGADPLRYTLAAVLVFVLADKVVLEQYLTWPLPFLLVLALAGRRAERAASWALYVLLTVVGLLVNPYVHPFGTAPLWLAVVLAAALAGYLLVLGYCRYPSTSPSGRWRASSGFSSNSSRARRCRSRSHA